MRQLLSKDSLIRCGENSNGLGKKESTMKKIGNKIISAILAGMMLFGSVPLAGAAYEEYLPTITRLENENGVAMFYYTVPFEGDAFQYGFLTSSENMGTGSWWTQNWNGAGVEQSMNVHL